MGSVFSFFTTMERPRTCSRSPGATTLSGSMPVRWFGTMAASFANQKLATSVRTRPFSGMGVGMITS